MIFMTSCGWAFLTILLPAGTTRAEAGIRFDQPYTNLFAAKEAAFSMTASSGKALASRISWRLTAGNRTIRSGEQAVMLQSGRKATITIHFEIPPVKEGVILPLGLTASLLTKRSRALASVRKNLWAFPENPFALQKEWLKSLNIYLFDPEETIGEQLEALDVPFEVAHHLAAISTMKNGFLLVGERISFDDYRGLGEVLIQAAARGIRVLCLAPVGGNLLLPGTEDAPRPCPAEFHFRQTKIITELDKRLDANGWPDEGKVTASSMSILAGRAGVLAEFRDGPGGWPWFEARYGAGNGRLVICGFGISKYWKQGPTPRYLLRDLFEYVNPRPKENQK